MYKKLTRILTFITNIYDYHFSMYSIRYAQAHRNISTRYFEKFNP